MPKNPRLHVRPSKKVEPQPVLVSKPVTVPPTPEPEKPLTKSDLEGVANKPQWLLVLIALGMWHPFGLGVAGSLAVVYCIIGYLRGWKA
jgi:hypothetical protein